jgi:hypothetical protein
MEILEILEGQIVAQIEGRTSICAYFDDVNSPEFMEIYRQFGECWLKPAFFNQKRISPSEYAEITAMFTGEQKFNTDDEIIRHPSLDGFFNKYYNGR